MNIEHIQHEYRDANYAKDKKNKKRKKDKDSDAEDDGNVPLLEPETIENIKENVTGTVVAASTDELLQSHVTASRDDDEEDDEDDADKHLVRKK